ncbi:hypothetical protein MMPV_001080 [Pyropia vietnamensis]
MGAPVSRPRGQGAGNAAEGGPIPASSSHDHSAVTPPSSVVTPSPSASPPLPTPLVRQQTPVATKGKAVVATAVAASRSWGPPLKPTRRLTGGAGGGRVPQSGRGATPVHSAAKAAAAAAASTGVPAPPAPTSACESCGTAHDRTYGSGRFCSVHCARRVAAGRKWANQRSAQKRAVEAEAVARKRRRSGSGGAVPLLPLPPSLPLSPSNTAAAVAAAVSRAAHSAQVAAAAAATAVAVNAAAVPTATPYGSVGLQLAAPAVPSPAVAAAVAAGAATPRVLLPALTHVGTVPVDPYHQPYPSVYTQGMLLTPAYFGPPVGSGARGIPPPPTVPSLSPSSLPPPPPSKLPRPPPRRSPVRSSPPPRSSPLSRASPPLLPSQSLPPSPPLPSSLPLPTTLLSLPSPSPPLRRVVEPSQQSPVPALPTAKSPSRPAERVSQSCPLPARHPRSSSIAVVDTGQSSDDMVPAGPVVSDGSGMPVQSVRSATVPPPVLSGLATDPDGAGAEAGLAAEALLRLSRHDLVGVPAS